jgi:hypothetical protein
MSMAEFSQWLYAIPVSRYLRNAGWIVPTVQSAHIVAIAVLLGSGIVIDLKLAGLVARTESARAVFARYMPWLWGALTMLLLTGLVMVTAEPDRVLSNWVFWTKMTLVVIGFVSTLMIRSPMLRTERAPDTSGWSIAAKPVGLLSLAIWIAIILCGRWIAYVL